MKSFLRHIHACNQHDPNAFIPFNVDDVQVGHLRPAFAKILTSWPETFRLSKYGIDLVVDNLGMQHRSQAVEVVLRQLVNQGVLSHLHGEQYVATSSTREAGVLLIDRAAAPYFGIRAFGQHINGYVLKQGKIKMWVGKRSSDRYHYP